MCVHRMCVVLIVLIASNAITQIFNKFYIHCTRTRVSREKSGLKCCDRAWWRNSVPKPGARDPGKKWIYSQFTRLQETYPGILIILFFTVHRILYTSSFSNIWKRMLHICEGEEHLLHHFGRFVTSFCRSSAPFASRKSSTLINYVSSCACLLVFFPYFLPCHRCA